MTITTVRDLINSIPHLKVVGPVAMRRRTIRSFSTDTRSLTTRDAFIALVGENFDGHTFVDAATRNGASVLVVAREWFQQQQMLPALPIVVVEDTLTAYGQIATSHRIQFNIPVIAVAGSNGKTTTKELVADVLASRYNVLRTQGNLNNLIGVPAMMLRMNAEHTAAVIEIGTNAPGEIQRLCQILQPTHGLITNIGREHLELLGSLDGVAKEEGSLFQYLAASNGIAFVNRADARIAAMAKGLKNCICYGQGRGVDIAGRIIRLNRFGAPAMLVTDSRRAKPVTMDVQLQTPGRHTAQNALAAAAVGLAMKVPPRYIRHVIEDFRPHIYSSGYARLAPMQLPNGARMLNDTYNANPDSVIAALETLSAIRPGRTGRRIVILADMKELGDSSRTEHELIGQKISSMGTIDLALFFGSEMRRAHRTLSSANKVNVESHYFTRKDQLIQTLLKQLTPADVVLVKGSRTMKMEEVVQSLMQMNNPN